MDEPFSALDAQMNLRMRTELLRILEEERHTVMLITHDVEEAIYMADRIMVLSPRPTTIQATFQVDLPHPRKLSSPQAQQLLRGHPQGAGALAGSGALAPESVCDKDSVPAVLSPKTPQRPASRWAERQMAAVP
jgi:energy-coupling factor transporter ATP-binding protein EcfA2